MIILGILAAMATSFIWSRMRRELTDFVGCAVAAPSDGIFHPATITGIVPDEADGELIRYEIIDYYSSTGKCR